MKCTLSGSNAKILAKAVQSFARITSELYIEAEDSGLTLRGVNQSKSAYAAMIFQLPFFSVYTVDPSTDEYNNKCKISIKACLNIFKNMNKVEQCILRLDSTAFKFIIQLKCHSKTVKTHFVSTLEQESLQVAHVTDNVPNCLIASRKIFQEIISNFQTNQEEITFETNDDGLTVKNYIEGTHIDSRYMRSQLKLKSSEFDSFRIADEASITFCLRELRALLNFADSLQANVRMKFDKAGRPVVFTLQKVHMLDAKLVISTLAPDIFNECTNESTGQSFPAKNTTPSKNTTKAAAKKVSANKLLPKDHAIAVAAPAVNENGKEATAKRPPCILDADGDDCFVSEQLFNFSRKIDTPNVLTNRNEVNATTSRSVHTTGRPAIELSSANKTDQRIIDAAPVPSPQSTSKSTVNSKAESVVTVQPCASEEVDVIFQDDDASASTDNNFADYTIPPSPERIQRFRKLKKIFRLGQDQTFDPRQLPGYSQILAENSDNEDEDTV